MTILTDPTFLALSALGARISGGKLYSRLSGTTTPVATFSNAALTIQHANPIVANSSGEFPAIYVDPTVNYRFIATDGSDAGNDPSLEVQLWLRDDYKIGLTLSYDFTIAIAGAVGTSQRALGPNAVRAFTLPANFAGSRATLQIAPTAQTVFSVQRNSVEIGTITFATSSQNGTLAASGALTINDGDQIDILAPATTNSADGLRATFKGSVVT